MACLSYNRILNVGFAVFKVFNHFFEVLEHEVLVVEKFLVCCELLVPVLRNFVPLLKDCHCVVVFLAEEEHVETALFVVFGGEREGTFREDGHIDSRHQTQNLNIVYGGIFTLMESLLFCIVGSISRSKGLPASGLLFFLSRLTL